MDRPIGSAGGLQGLLGPAADPAAERKPLASHLPLLAYVEGKHDAEFLRRISRLLHAARPELPSLADLEEQGQLVFVPMGGGNMAGWFGRLASLGKAEFFLFDREAPPDTAVRQKLLVELGARPRCRAFVTSKRALENYLHPEAIAEVRGVRMVVTDQSHVPDDAARQLFLTRNEQVRWEDLPARARRRGREAAKRWLNTLAVERMTIERLLVRDPQGEVALWLAAIAELIGGAE